jgi:hypothetical protein
MGIAVTFPSFVRREGARYDGSARPRVSASLSRRFLGRVSAEAAD